jgi:eukaryotic-like serine/threonine-protein kinase
MKSASWEKAKIIFEQAMAVAPGERGRFLDEVCPDDEIVRGEVEALLSSLDETASFLETPAVSEKRNELASGQVFGHYEILRQIGAGGMGEVYLAEDKKLDRRVAIKILNAEVSRHESSLERFIREAKTASALDHPNILVIHEIGESEESHFIVSEYIKGKTLREIMQTERRHLDGVPFLSEVLGIAIQIAAALVAAHEAHLVHRDIKPENVMIRPDGLVKVLDFGLAKLVEQKNRPLLGLDDEAAKQSNTAQGVIVGTVNYMSPEQAKGERVDERTDIFSFGVLLYEMIAGRTPFGGDSAPETFANLINKAPPPLENLTSGQIPAELDSIITKALRKNPDERYQTSKELFLDLQRLRQQLETESHLERFAPPEASSATTTARAATRSAPRRVVIAAILLALALGALAYGWRWRQNSVAPRAEIKSLAVLPLKSLDAGDDYLGLGIADAVIRRISQTGELIVRPTSAVRRYLDEDTDAITAARQLNADAVLEGSVQRADEHLRVSVSLLRTSDGVSLWAESFDMRTADIFTIQDTVAQQVAARLRLRLDPAQQARLGKRSTSNPIAYEFYVKGVYSSDQRGFGPDAKPQMEATIALFKKAIEADPDYALAHAQLANAYIWTALFIEEQAVWAERAKEEMNRADALDPHLAETHVARHWLLGSAYEGWQSEAAVRELLLAQQLNPNVGHVELGSIYYHLGLEDLGDRAYQRALDIDPTSEYVKYMTYAHYSLVRKHDEAFATYQKFNPNDTTTPLAYLMGKGHLDEAQKRLDELSVKHPDNPGLALPKALLSALKGDFRTAEALVPAILSISNPQNFAYHHITYDVACIYALTGKSDEAVKWLRKTAAEGFPSYPLLERDHFLNRIRQEPEFIKFMTEMKEQHERYRSEFK